MLSKADVKKMKWCASEYDDFTLRVPVGAKEGDVGFVCDNEHKLVIKECVISLLKEESEMPPRTDNYSESLEYWKERGRLKMDYNYTGEFITPDRTFVVAMTVVRGNPSLDFDDFNDVYFC